MGEIRFVGTGETRGYPYLVCKKLFSVTGAISVSFSVFLRLLAHDVRVILQVFSLLEMNRPFFLLCKTPFCLRI